MRDVQTNDNEIAKKDERLPWRTPTYRRIAAAGSETSPGASADGNIIES